MHTFRVRYLVVAAAALIGAAADLWILRQAKRAQRLVPAIAVFGTSTMAAVVAAILLGTTLGLGIIVVAVSFGLCFAAAALFFVLART